MEFPGKNAGVGCHFLLQAIFPTQKSNPWFLRLLALAGGFFAAASSLTQDSVYMSMPRSRFVPPFLPLSPPPQVCCLCLHLYSCPANKVISTIFLSPFWTWGNWDSIPQLVGGKEEIWTQVYMTPLHHLFPIIFTECALIYPFRVNTLVDIINLDMSYFKNTSQALTFCLPPLNYKHSPDWLQKLALPIFPERT